jgi:hypothetical protein
MVVVFVRGQSTQLTCCRRGRPARTASYPQVPEFRAAVRERHTFTPDGFALESSPLMIE